MEGGVTLRPGASWPGDIYGGTPAVGSPGSLLRRRPAAGRALPLHTGLPGHSWPWASEAGEAASVWGHSTATEWPHTGGHGSLAPWSHTFHRAQGDQEMSGAPRTAEPGTGQQGLHRGLQTSLGFPTPQNVLGLGFPIWKADTQHPLRAESVSGAQALAPGAPPCPGRQ